MARKEQKTKVKDGHDDAVKVRVLADCQFGKGNDVVELNKDQLAEAKALGLVDDDVEAVAYAESLK